MTTADVLKALADDVRLDIVRHLSTKKAPVPSTDVVASCSDALKLAQPTMSYHMAKLIAAGIVREQKVGKQKFYSLDNAKLRDIGIDMKKL